MIGQLYTRDLYHLPSEGTRTGCLNTRGLYYFPSEVIRIGQPHTTDLVHPGSEGTSIVQTLHFTKGLSIQCSRGLHHLTREGTKYKNIYC